MTWHRVVLQRARLESSVLPGWAVDVLTNRSFHTFAAKVIIATELFIALGLWWRTRNVAVWIAVCFHVTIQLTASVEVFSYLAIAALVIWSVPSTRDRLLEIDPLDRRPTPPGPHGRCARLAGPVPHRARRTGHRRCASSTATAASSVGGRAVRFACSRLPVTAWFALPTLITIGRRPPTRTPEETTVSATRPAVVAAPRWRSPAGATGPCRLPVRRVSLAAGGLVLVAAVTFGVLAPPEHCPARRRPTCEASATAAVQWFVRNQHPDGTWLYEYDAGQRRVSDGYNFVRHAGAVMGLYQAATVGIPDALESADRGSAWVRDRLVEHDGWTALASDGRAPVGATALYVAAARRAART